MSDPASRGYVWLFAFAALASGCTDTGPGQFSAGVFDVGGRKMYLECDGFGTPTVVLIAGKGNRADTWSASVDLRTTVFRQVAGVTRVCAYDRPMTVGNYGEPSRSDAVPEPVTAQDGVSDLHALLSAANVQAPYVIVGHSYGGLIARLYASTFPSVVAGLVLEDALSERIYDGLTPQQREVFEAINLVPERVDNVRTFAQVVNAPRVQPMPMEILTADLRPITAQDIALGGYPSDVTVEFADALWAAQIVAQNYLATLFPFAKHITKTNSHHYIHVEQPQLVIDAIREVVDEVRAANR